MKEYITVEELAERWGVGKQTIYNKVKNGVGLPDISRIGRSVRFKMSDVVEYEQTVLKGLD